MRVAVVGATGNVGTALLRALAVTPEVDDVLGIARRLPDESSEPYRGARWASADIGRPADQDGAADELVELFDGMDAVVHLAWLIQPNHERDLLRRVNVDGTARVARAAGRAGVRHLVVASSVGAYSPVGDRRPRDERHATGGVASSHYSVDKAAQERVLDEVGGEFPDLLVTRLRPALTFQADAGTEIGAYFLGPAVPPGLVRPGRLPLLPWPGGLTLQAVHTDDVAQAYVRALLTRAPGAFNIAADDLLGGRAVARVIDHGRVAEVRAPLVRAALAIAWRARAVPTDPGWLDMGLGAPVMDTTRAREVLGWSPRWSAHEAVRAVAEAIAEGRGAPSPPLLARRARLGSGRVTFAGEPGDRGAQLGGELLRARTGPGVDRGLLGLYLSDHVTGATAGLGRARRMADDLSDMPFAADLADFAADLERERGLIVDLIDVLDLNLRPYRQAAAWIGERAGRLKPNRRLRRRSPMTPVLELELMRSAVNGKAGVWQTLAHIAPELGLDGTRFTDLARRAEEQSAMLADAHRQAEEGAFTRREPGDEHHERRGVHA